jgi:hypothetical protein
VTKREELAAKYIGLLQGKQFDEAVKLVAESATLTVPGMPSMSGRDTIAVAMRMAAESGRGLEKVGFPAPKEQADGSVVAAGVAPTGLLKLVAMVLRKVQKVTITLRFASDDMIEAMEIAMG